MIAESATLPEIIAMLQDVAVVEQTAELIVALARHGEITSTGTILDLTPSRVHPP